MGSTGLRAGTARVDITPPVGTDLTGFLMRAGPSVGVHDRLYARALALDDGHTQVLVITCDLLALDAAFVGTVRYAIEQTTGIPAGHIMIAASHTHAGPASVFLRHCGAINPGWMAELAGQLVAVSRAALASRRPARIAAGAVPVPGVGFNRRQLGGLTDPDLGIIRVDDVEGSPLAALLVFGCHPVAAGPRNRLISADYPGVLVRAVEIETGATTLFASGACGDVNPVAVVEPRLEVGGTFDLVEAIGRSLAEAALAAWPKLTPSQPGTLRAVSSSLVLPLQRIPSFAQLAALAVTSRAEMAQAATDVSGEQYKVAAAMLDWVEATIEARRRGRLCAQVTAEIQVIALGTVALVGVPGELFAALGLAIKRGAPVPHTLVLSNTNGSVGYIPTGEAYGQGGYEVDTAYRYYGYPAALAPEAGDMVVTAAIELIRAVVER